MKSYAVSRVGANPYRREYFENRENALTAARVRSEQAPGRWQAAEWAPEYEEWDTLATYERGCACSA